MICEKADEDGVVIIRWPSSGCSARVGLSCGRLLSWSSPSSGEVICEPVDLCLYRAGTDNDRGGGFFSYYTRWKELGLDSLSRKVEGKAAVRSYFVRATDGAVVVSCAFVCTLAGRLTDISCGHAGIGFMDFGEQHGGALHAFDCFE